MKKLDDVLNETNHKIDLKQISFIKMDAEGSEPAILAGMEKILQSSSPIISLEFHFECLKSAGTSAHEFKERLESYGFEVFRIEWTRNLFLNGRLQLKPLYFNDEEGDTVDTVAVKPDSPFRSRIQALIVN